MDTLQFLQQQLWLYFIIIAFLGLVIGSFLNVIIIRLPKMLLREWNKECHEFLKLTYLPEQPERFDLISPASHCPHCKKTLKPWQLIPVISFILQRGRCVYCQAKISWRYPCVEMLCCITSVMIAWKFGVSWQALAGLLFTWIILALIFIDIDTQLLPDQLTGLLLWLGLFFSLFSLFCESHTAIIGAIFGYLIFALSAWIFTTVTGRLGMGNGDFKFLAALGAFLGWQQLPMIILIASVMGTLFGIAYMIAKRQFKSVPLPFGPYLAVAGWIALVTGHTLTKFYLPY